MSKNQRVDLSLIMVFLSLLTTFLGAILNFKTNTIIDLLFLPTVVTFTVAILLFIGANKKILDK